MSTSTSNKALRKEILDLNATAKVEDLNNKELSSLREDLQKPKADTEVKQRGPQFTVAKGKSIVAGVRGMIKAGDAITAETLSKGEDGQNALKNLVASGDVNQNW